MNWLDLGIILFIILFVVLGIRQGFMKSILSHFSLGINCLISFFLCQPIKWFLSKVGLYGTIAASYSGKLVAASPVLSQNLVGLSGAELSSVVRDGINNSGLSKLSQLMFKWFLKPGTVEETLKNSDVSSKTMADIISNTYANFFTTIIAFISCVIILYFLVFLFRKLAEKLRQCGFVRVVDGILGAVYGLFRCFLISLILCLIIKLMSSLSFMSEVINYIDGSFFGKLIYNQINNLIDAFFKLW